MDITSLEASHTVWGPIITKPEAQFALLFDA